MIKARGVVALAVALLASVGYASPQNLVTHNLTNVESNAYVGGVFPSPIPSKPNATTNVSWFVVKMACFGHTTNGKCPALIKMATNTSSPVELGMVYLDLDTGLITPSSLVNNGYRLTVNGPAEATLTKE